MGSQAEIGVTTIRGKHFVTGGLYGERNGRGEIANMSDENMRRVLASLSGSDWSDYLITAVEDRIILQVNGITTIDMRDSKGERSGHIGLQLHGVGTTAAFKDIRIQPIEPAKANSQR